MIHRTKVEKSAVSTHTERDNLSETDPHSQSSDEVNCAPQAGPGSNRKARVCHYRTKTTGSLTFCISYYRIDAASIPGLVFCFHWALFVSVSLQR